MKKGFRDWGFQIIPFMYAVRSNGEQTLMVSAEQAEIESLAITTKQT